MHRHPVVGHLYRVHRWLQQRSIVVVGWSSDDAERDTGPFDGQRPFEPLLVPIDRAAPGHLAAAGRLGDPAIDRQVSHFRANHAVLGSEYQREQHIHHAGSDSSIAATAQGGGRDGVVSDAVGGAAEDEDLHEFVEDEAIGDARAMATERMVVRRFGQQHGDLVPDGSMMDDGMAGTGRLLTRKA